MATTPPEPEIPSFDLSEAYAQAEKARDRLVARREEIKKERQKLSTEQQSITEQLAQINRLLGSKEKRKVTRKKTATAVITATPPAPENPPSFKPE